MEECEKTIVDEQIHVLVDAKKEANVWKAG